MFGIYKYCLNLWADASAFCMVTMACNAVWKEMQIAPHCFNYRILDTYCLTNLPKAMSKTIMLAVCIIAASSALCR